MASYAVTFNIKKQSSYDRVQVAIRVVILIILSIIGAVGWLSGLLWLGIPVLAAIMISQKGAATYLAESEENMVRWLRYVTAFYAYIGMLTDKLPNEDPHQTLQFDVRPSGEPTVGGVLLRIITVIPHMIVLGLLGIVALVLLVVAAVMILISESYPEGIFTFLRGYLRWEVRVYVYLAGLTQEYPPFAFDTGEESPAAPALPPGDTSQTSAT
jgi:hypothetical protein